jgi:hypothetical protein
MTTTIIAPSSTAAGLEDLTSQTRRLWMREPEVDSALRSDVLAELLDIDLTLQRLTLRNTWAVLDSEQIGELDTCRRRLADLSDRWSPDS